MATAYFIGGAPRVAKSTLLAKLLQVKPMPSASTDDMRSKLRLTISEEVEPALYYLDSLNQDEANMARLMLEETNAIITATNAESAVVWRKVEPFVITHLAAGNDVAVEGIALLPYQLTELDFDYRVVHLGNQSPSHAEIIQNYAKSHPQSWLGGLKPTTITAFAHYAQAYSQQVEAQAIKYHQDYLDMASGSFESALDKALAALLTD